VSKTITITPEAIKDATDEQILAVARLVAPETVASITVTKGTFGLPEDYLAFAYHYEGGGSIYGGIDTDGSVST